MIKGFDELKEPEYSNTTYDIENNDEVEELFEDDKSFRTNIKMYLRSSTRLNICIYKENEFWKKI